MTRPNAMGKIASLHRGRTWQKRSLTDKKKLIASRQDDRGQARGENRP